MAIDLSVLITKRFPPGDLYRPELRLEFGQWDPPQSSMPYTSLLDDTVRNGEDAIENANRRWAAEFPARNRAGQSSGGADDLGTTRVSPLNVPERTRGTVFASSV